MVTNFSSIIEDTKPQATPSTGPQGALTVTVEVIISSPTPNWLLKTQLFEKKANSPVKKTFGLFFLVLSRVRSLSRQLVRVQKAFRQLLWKL